MNELTLQLTNGARLVVPASLDSITTYVLLEQEAWFEKEVAFLNHLLRPGMTAIDIGANLGVYSIPMARLVGPTGKIFAYEPGTEARTLLEKSRTLNQVCNLEIVAAALSDGEREGCLKVALSSELNSLSDEGDGERVRVTSLDLEQARCHWPSPDFVKIDAEGEEENILRGGTAFFKKHSPLVLFEIKAGLAVNESLRAAFPAMGYRVFRLLPGAPILVPDRIDQPLSDYELNLFAAKPDRVAELARAGLLVEEWTSWQPSETDRRQALDLWQTQLFAPPFMSRLGAPLDADYRDALAAYAAWRSATIPLAERCTALDFACRTLTALCERSGSFPRLSTLARIAFEAGQTHVSVAALELLVREATAKKVFVSEPFWPACSRYDRLTPDADIDAWFTSAAVEQLEKTAHYSSIFGGFIKQLDWLCGKPWATAEMERRRTLFRGRSGATVIVPARLRTPAADHLNADLWRRGLVPNTVLAG